MTNENERCQLLNFEQCGHVQNFDIDESLAGVRGRPKATAAHPSFSPTINCVLEHRKEEKISAQMSTLVFSI